MKIFLLFGCFLVFKISPAQQSHRLTYVAITFEKAKGELSKKQFYRIVDETNNQLAWDIIGLVPYDEWNNTIFIDMFYNGYLDSTRKYYNYFERLGDAIQFLADNRWELVTIYQDNYSDGQNIYSRPIYYFKKELNQ